MALACPRVTCRSQMHPLLLASLALPTEAPERARLTPKPGNTNRDGIDPTLCQSSQIYLCFVWSMSWSENLNSTEYI